MRRSPKVLRGLSTGDFQEALRGCLGPTRFGGPLINPVDERWRPLNGAHLLPVLRAGVRFVDGTPVERQEDNS